MRTTTIRVPLNSETAFFAIAETGKEYCRKGKLGSAVKIQGGEIVFTIVEPEPEDLADRIGLHNLGIERHREGDERRSAQLDAAGLPVAKPFECEGKPFNVLDYASDEYAAAETMNEAIKMRGDKAFAANVEPDYFAEDPRGTKKIGMAELWSQSSWGDAGKQRNTENEEAAASLQKGDVLTVRPFSEDERLGSGENWNEIADLGFAFYRNGTILPYTPFHDYDQDLFLDALLTLNEGESVACVMLDGEVNGEDGIPVDEDFHWRVYSRKAIVLKVFRAS